MSFFSIKMRASKTDDGFSVHVSGAEKILSKQEIKKNTSALIDRAFQHSKGSADFINLKIEKFPKYVTLP